MTASTESTAQLDASVRRVVYDGFISRRTALFSADVAAHLALPEAQIAASFERLAAAHMLVLQPESREILMANPFSAVPTTFSVTIGSQSWWGSCVWDSLGIIAMMGQDGIVETSCPDCGETLTLTVENGDLLQSDAIAHFTVPAAQWWDDIVFN